MSYDVLPVSFVDIHNHCLWGVDDGAEEEEATFRMLQQAVRDGITVIVATPHIEPGLAPFPYEQFAAAYRRSLKYIQDMQLPLLLCTGHEILYTDHTVRYLQEGRAYPLSGTHSVLIEFSPDEPKSRISEAVQKIGMIGYRPILAHAERYLNLIRAEQIRTLKDEGAEIQINARSILRKQPLLRRRYFDSLFEQGLVDYIATDTHDMPGRETCMTKAYEELEFRLGPDEAKRLCRDQAREMLSL